MTRSFDTIPDEAGRSADISKPSVPVMTVCPFCGAISEKAEIPCPRCKMENSATTRQATRARIGPWYVMQSKNPSAPGMKCSTLLALIRKGQITPRSVIRGPTTFQLWRFAARVKGISREFGLCYSCSAELQRTSTFCPKCSRSQELPPNPDVLLENESQSKTVFREVPRDVPRPATPPEPAHSEAVQAAAPIEPEQSRPQRPAGQIPSAAETMAELAEIPSPHNAPAALQSRPQQRPQEGVLTPRELAAAFSLQYDPTMDVAGGSTRRRGGKGLLTAAALLLAAGGIGATFYYVPSIRQRFVAWVQDSAPSNSTMTPDNVSPQKKSASDSTPDWMMTVPDNSSPVTTHAPARPSPSNSTPPANIAPSNPAPSNSAPLTPAPSNPAPSNGSPSNTAPTLVSPSAPAPSNPAPSAPKSESNNSQVALNAQSPSNPPPVGNSQPKNSAPTNPVPSNPAPSNSSLNNAAPATPPASPAPAENTQPAPVNPAPIALAPASQPPAAHQAPADDSAPITTTTPNSMASSLDGRSVAADTASKLRQSAGDDLDSLAMKLRSNGLDAEHRQDLAAAQYYYEQVETLPRDNWPGDIDRLLKNVQKRMLASATH
jgi:hypothetical protein